ncbi:MAG: hypothetical protein KKC77_19335 [Proteobacteria bacterium]|nr:hypothetical protein [Pseudomonadota bacterium]
MAKTTKAHFETFKKEAQDWVKVLGLIGWEITYKHEDMPNDLAVCRGNLGAMAADIVLGKDWDDEPITEDAIVNSAHHEVLELLLFEMAILAESRYCTGQQLETARHRVIQTLMNVMER